MLDAGNTQIDRIRCRRIRPLEYAPRRGIERIGYPHDHIPQSVGEKCDVYLRGFNPDLIAGTQSRHPASVKRWFDIICTSYCTD